MLTKDKVIIRDATFEDIEAITLLMPDLSYPSTLEEMQTRLKAIFTHPDYRTILAVVNGEVVGMSGLCKGIFYEKNGMYMRILVFVVKQSSRKQGIGELLIKASEDWAIEQNLNAVLISSGNRDDRKAAHIFYEKMGYAIKSSLFVKQL